ncbi:MULTISPECIES: WXG100 family type VII secretion target [unclassified Gordonia (in: high G+C Gram-positive bacteria)]
MNLDGSGGGAVDIDVSSALGTAQSVSGLVDEMQETINRIGRASANGVADWGGKASSAFDTTHTDWNSSAMTLNSALNDIRTQLTSGFTGYEDHDGQAASGFDTGGPTLRL